MIYRLSQIINPRWLLYAGSAQASCAVQLPKQSQTEYPSSPAVIAWQPSCKSRLYSPRRNSKRAAEIEVATNVGALSP